MFSPTCLPNKQNIEYREKSSSSIITEFRTTLPQKPLPAFAFTSTSTSTSALASSSQSSSSSSSRCLKYYSARAIIFLFSLSSSHMYPMQTNVCPAIRLSICEWSPLLFRIRKKSIASPYSNTILFVCCTTMTTMFPTATPFL